MCQAAGLQCRQGTVDACELKEFRIQQLVQLLGESLARWSILQGYLEAVYLHQGTMAGTTLVMMACDWLH